MRANAFLSASALGLVLGSASAAACYRHTFDECPAEPAQHDVVVNTVTGTTHTAPQSPAVAVEAASERFAKGGMLAGGEPAKDEALGSWSTRVSAN